MPTRSGKVIQADYDFVLAQGDEKICFALSRKTVATLLPLLDFMRWKTRWFSQVGTPIVQDTIDEITDNAVKELILEESCEQLRCQDYAPSASVIEWQPQNPFTQPDYAPPGYGVPPFVVITEPSITGLLAGDVITDLSRAPGTMTPIYDLPATILELFESGLPRFRVTLGTGDGTVRLHLLNILLGGRAVVVHDDDILGNGLVVELNLDSVALPPETNVEVVIEREITGEGEHWIDVTFIPAVNEELPFVFYGGGLRLVEICGFGRGTDTDMCCDETNAALDQIMRLNLQTAYDGTPQSIAEDMPTNFDGMPESAFEQVAYENALCVAVTSFLQNALLEAGESFGIQQAIEAALLLIIAVINPIIGLIGGAQLAFEAEDLEAALEDEAAFNSVICCILRGLRGREVTQSNFNNALANSGCTLDSEHETVIKDVWQAYASTLNGYRAFLNHYQAMLQAGDTESNGKCPCCESGQIAPRLWYGFQEALGESEPNHDRIESMSWSGNILTVIPYKTHGDSFWINEYEVGFWLKSDCCLRARFLMPTTLLCGSGAAYLGGANVSGGYSARDVGRTCEGATDCGAGNAIGDEDGWFCFDQLRVRLWWNYGVSGYPAFMDDGFQIEFDPEYVC